MVLPSTFLSEAHYPSLHSWETWLSLMPKQFAARGGWLQRFARQKLPSPFAVSLFSIRLTRTSNPPYTHAERSLPCGQACFSVSICCFLRKANDTPSPGNSYTDLSLCQWLVHFRERWVKKGRWGVFTHLRNKKGKMINGKLAWSTESESARWKKKELNRSQKLSPSHRMANRWDARWCTHRISSSRGGGVTSYAFLCQGSMYSRPRWAKMSFSVVAAKNSF